MRLQHSFDVPASPERTLATLLDAERIVSCMPGAELVEVVDERTWKAKLRVKLGPVGLDFTNDVRVVAVDEDAGTVTLTASGRETRGKGGAEATIDSRLTALDGGGTRVEMDTDLRFSGQAAQLGRPAVVQDVSARLVDQFAACLRGHLDDEAPEEGAAPAERAAKPLSGFSLMWAAVSGAVARLFRRKPIKGEA